MRILVLLMALGLFVTSLEVRAETSGAAATGGQKSLFTEEEMKIEPALSDEEVANLVSSVNATDDIIPSVKAAKTAQGLCTLGLTPGQQMMVKSAAQQAVDMIGSGGTESTCKAAQTLSQVLGAANFAHGATCEAKIMACNRQVKKDRVTFANQPSAERKIDQAKETCDELQANVVAAVAAAIHNIAGYLQSSKCKKEIAAQNQIPGVTPPSALDCTNPMLSSQPSCVCAANPRDPMCSTMNTGLEGGNFASDGALGGAAGGLADPTLEGGIGFDDEIGLREPTNSGGVAQSGGGGGGGGVSGGGGGGGLPPEESGEAGEGPYKTDIMGGLAGGSGGGGGYLSGSGGSGDGGGKGLLDSLADKLNLKGFLPKADFKNRGLAGMAGTGADGITGPNGPSLFEKVTYRYRKEQPKLLP